MIEDATTYRTKDQVLFDLSKALRFSPESLEKNRKGALSAEQSKQFTGRCVQPILTTVALALAPFLLWTGLTGIRENVSYLAAFPILLARLTNIAQLVEAQGKFSAITLVGSFVLCLGAAVFSAVRISPQLCCDILDGKVTVMEGRVEAREETINRPNGRDPIENYFFGLKMHYFPVSLAAYRAIENGSMYLVYVLPRSRVMVSIEPKIGK